MAEISTELDYASVLAVASLAGLGHLISACGTDCLTNFIADSHLKLLLLFGLFLGITKQISALLFVICDIFLSIAH